jgi:hypothetical protein
MARPGKHRERASAATEKGTRREFKPIPNTCGDEGDAARARLAVRRPQGRGHEASASKEA